MDVEAQEEDTHEELAVLDRAGRLQIPREYLERLGLAGAKMVKVELEDERIVLRNPNTNREEKAAEAK